MAALIGSTLQDETGVQRAATDAWCCWSLLCYSEGITLKASSLGPLEPSVALTPPALSLGWIAALAPVLCRCPWAGAACPAVHSGLAKTTAWPIGGGFRIWKPGFSNSKLQSVLWASGLFVGWVSSVLFSQLFLAFKLCFAYRPFLNYSALPEVLLLKVLVLRSFKLLILPLTHI